MHISVFFFSFAERLNREPNSGRSPKIGSLVMFLISSSLSRPAITSVSPDLSRTWVFSLRVDTCGAELLPDSIHLVIVDTSGSSERVISPFCRSLMRGVTFKLTPTSLNSTELVTSLEVPLEEVEVKTGTSSPIRTLPSRPLATTICGQAMTLPFERVSS